MQGPPGTGKTQVAVGIVKCSLDAVPNGKILIMAPSNAGLDAIINRMRSQFPDMPVLRVTALSRQHSAKPDEDTVVLAEMVANTLTDNYTNEYVCII